MGKPIARSPSNDSVLSLCSLEKMVAATSIIQSTCRLCFSPCEAKAILLDLPNFKDIVLTVCECLVCGDKTRGIKTGDEISPKGRKSILRVRSPLEMKLELIKSETCSVVVPEIDLELTRGTLGTQFTTVEGLLRLVLEDLQRHVTSIQPDQAAEQSNETNALGIFLGKLEKLANGQETFTLIMDDPLSNSFVEEQDSISLIHEDYERSDSLNVELGLVINH